VRGLYTGVCKKYFAKYQEDYQKNAKFNADKILVEKFENVHTKIFNPKNFVGMSKLEKLHSFFTFIQLFWKELKYACVLETLASVFQKYFWFSYLLKI